MEGMNLAKLEAVVEKMLHNINELKRDKASLAAQLEARNATIADLEARLNALTANQEEVSNRVNNLLSSIEDWEQSAEPEDEEPAMLDSAEEEIPVEHSEKSNGGLFSIGE